MGTRFKERGSFQVLRVKNAEEKTGSGAEGHMGAMQKEEEEEDDSFLSNIYRGFLMATSSS